MANTLDAYFDQSEKMILRIAKTKSTEVLYNEAWKKLDVVMQKMGATPMTRTVRKLMDKLYFGYNANAIGSNLPVYGIYVGMGTDLGGIVVDIIKCSPDSAKDILELIKENYKLQQEKENLSKKVLPDTIEKITKIEEKINSNSKLLANLIDYERVVEATYFTFIRYLVAEIDKGHSTKLFELGIELFKSIILTTFGKVLNLTDRKLFNAAIDYIFTVSFTNMRPTEVINNIGRRYGKEMMQIFIDKNVKSIKSMNDITTLFAILKIANMTPISFNSILSKRIGDESLSILHSSYDYYIAWATITLHKSLLFEITAIDKEVQKQIETIVLNYKSRVRI